MARRCSACHSIVCSRCISDAKTGACVNCVIEEGERWFSPAAEEPLGKLPRRIPLALLALIVVGPLLLIAVAALMGRLRPERPEPAPVRFELPAR
ncbi:MAG TPA: hypothetical protein VKN99_14520 [Polyangia bacterium]|nr:hypothetical protein [Polyangia bacterium]